MSSEWISGKFQDFCDITRGASPRPIHDYLGNEGMPWIKIADATAESSRFISSTKEKIKLDGVRASVKVNPGDLILSNSATPGLPKFLRITACIHDGWMLLRNFKQLDKEFAYWLLLSERTKLVAQGNGSVFTNLKTDILKSHVVSLPPLNLQRKIAHSLNALDDRITLLRETNKTLEAIAQAIFKSWFVDFDPVRAKMEGRQPEGMDEATAALFPDSFEESEFGLVPKGWKLGKIRDLGEVVCGKTPPTKDVDNYGKDVPFITIPDMHGNLLITATARSLSKKGADSQQKKYLREGTVCVSCIATPGLVSQITFEAQTNQQINSVIPFPHWGDSFALFALKLIGNSVRIAGSGGSVFHNLSKSGFEELKVLLPTVQTAQQYNSIAESLTKKINSNQYSIQHLCDLRDTLLPPLISGKLRLPEASA